MDILPRKPCKGVSRQDFFQHIKAIRISDWHFKGVSRQNFFQNLKATRPRKARTQDTMPLALVRASPCYPDTIAILRCCPCYHIVEPFAPFNVTK